MSQGIGPDPNRFATELFNGLPRRYDALGYLLSMGQDRRWRSAVVDKIVAGPGDLVLDVATGTAGVALALRAATGAEITGIDLNARMLEGARQKLSKGRHAGRATRARSCRGPALRRRHVRRRLLHLSASVRRGPRGDRRRTGSSPQTGRRARGHGVLRAAIATLVPLVVVLHENGPADRGTAAGGQGVVRRGSLPRSQHRRSLPPSSGRRDDRVLGGGGNASTFTRDPMSLGGGIVMWGVKGRSD